MSERETSQLADRHTALANALRERYADKGCEVVERLSEVTMVVPKEALMTIATELRDDDTFCFEQVIDVCGVDYSTYGKSEWVTRGASSSGFGRGVDRQAKVRIEENQRFAAVYHLLSIKNNQRLRLRVFVDADYPVVDSVVDIWKGADWFEREAFDLYGILFNGHPDLRRILTDYGFLGHPFRKDFPLEGEVEMRYDAEKQRVVYEPVKIVSRTLVPKVVREDNRYAEEHQQGGDDA